MARLPAWCLLLAALTSCHVAREVPLKIRGLRLDPLVHDCYLVNVTGAGVIPTYATADFPSPITPQCLGLGTTSALLSAGEVTSPQGVSLRVRAGAVRIVEVLGIKAAENCVGKSLPALFDGERPEVYRLGTATANLLAGGSVRVANTYAGPAEPNRTNLCPTAPGNRVLSLTHAYHGGLMINPDDSETLYGENLGNVRPMPLRYDGTTPPEMNQFTNLHAFLTTRWATPGVETPHEMHGRVDMLFSVAGIDVDDYRRIQVRAKILGGKVNSDAGQCNLLTTIVVNPGAELRLRKGSEWEDASAVHTGTTPGEVTIVANTPGNYVRNISGSETQAEPFVHMTVRATNGVSATSACSFVQVDSIQAELVP